MDEAHGWEQQRFGTSSNQADAAINSSTTHAPIHISLGSPVIQNTIVTKPSISALTMQSSSLPIQSNAQHQDDERRNDVNLRAFSHMLPEQTRSTAEEREGWQVPKAAKRRSMFGSQEALMDDDSSDYYEFEEFESKGANSAFCATTDSPGHSLTDIWKARWLLIVAAALYGTNFPMVKLLDDEMPVAISVALRFGLASFVTLPWFFQSTSLHMLSKTVAAVSCREGVNCSSEIEQHDHHDKGSWWDDFTTVILGDTVTPEHAVLAATFAGFEVGFWDAIGFMAQAIGLETTPATESAFLCSLVVVIVPILDFLSGKRLKRKQMAGVILAVVGVAFLELGGISTNRDNFWSFFNFGDFASSMQPLAFGLGFWRKEKAMALYPQHAARVTAAEMLAVFIACVGYWAMSCGLMHTACADVSQLLVWLTNPPILFAIFWTSVITIALTVYMETVAMKTLSAAETTLIFSTEPLWGTAFAALVMGEQFGWDVTIGAIFILSGCIVSNLGVSCIKGKALKTSNKETPGPQSDIESPHGILS